MAPDTHVCLGGRVVQAVAEETIRCFLQPESDKETAYLEQVAR